MQIFHLLKYTLPCRGPPHKSHIVSGEDTLHWQQWMTDHVSFDMLALCSDMGQKCATCPVSQLHEPPCGWTGNRILLVPPLHPQQIPLPGDLPNIVSDLISCFLNLPLPHSLASSILLTWPFTTQPILPLRSPVKIVPKCELGFPLLCISWFVLGTQLPGILGLSSHQPEYSPGFLHPCIS